MWEWEWLNSDGRRKSRLALKRGRIAEAGLESPSRLPLALAFSPIAGNGKPSGVGTAGRSIRWAPLTEKFTTAFISLDFVWSHRQRPSSPRERKSDSLSPTENDHLMNEVEGQNSNRYLTVLPDCRV